ncbi:hypothetical protein CP02DC14_2034, partial [Chlamydia psittaci 02DC14]
HKNEPLSKKSGIWGSLYIGLSPILFLFKLFLKKIRKNPQIILWIFALIILQF